MWLEIVSCEPGLKEQALREPFVTGVGVEGANVLGGVAVGGGVVGAKVAREGDVTCDGYSSKDESVSRLT